MNYSHVLYHAQCPDGFGAAWAAWKKFGDTAQYIPVHYGEPFPKLPLAADVIMLDTAYKRDRHEMLKALVHSLTVVDHHKTNVDELAKLPDVHIDLSHSGAVLAWLFFHPSAPIPELLKYIEDYDLWRFMLPNSLEISAAISSYAKDFEAWSNLSTTIETEDGKKKMVEDGSAILRYKRQKVAEVCENSFWMTVAGYKVPVVNAVNFQSEVGNMLCKLHPEAPFAAFYYEKEKIRCWGLRSVGDFDVSNIAKALGGGGHKNSAGFTEPMERKRAW